MENMKTLQEKHEKGGPWRYNNAFYYTKQIREE